MRFNSSLLLGIVGILATYTEDPGDNGELPDVHLELQAAHAEIASLKVEIVRLKGELDECVAGPVCSSCSTATHTTHHAQNLRCS